MKSPLSGAVSLFALVLTFSCSSVPRNPWAEVLSPTEGPDQTAHAIGGYSAGCLIGARPLPLEGKGYQLMRPSRRRNFGHPSLIRYVEGLASQVSSKNLGTLLIGDLAQPRGGPTNSSHRSHQTGLDADIWFLQPEEAHKKALTLRDREDLAAVSVLTAQDGVLHPQYWTTAQVDVLKLAAEQPEVERIFVHPSIKLYLCNAFERERGRNLSWLSKIRPWWNHQDHFHVRLRCPIDQPECLKQAEPPSGNGCDATLKWWFTDEAKASPSREPIGVIPPLPKLPEACGRVLEMGSSFHPSP